MHKLIVITNLLILISIKLSLGFNLSPIPNYELNLPKQNYFKEKTKSSYFGYQINLRKNSVIIAAPRLQPILESQRNIEEPGGLFKCDIKLEKCEPFVMDPNGNVLPEVHASTFEGVKKETQWFGSAIDGQSSESDSFISCAPNIITVVEQANNQELHYLFNGACYLGQDTLKNATSSRLLAPLRHRQKMNLNVDGKNIIYYMFGQLGLSVHITENSEEILIGAPGVYTWKGTVVRYRTPDFFDAPGVSRRDLGNIAAQRRKNVLKFEAEIANPSYWDQKDDSYFGYAVTSGYFVGNTSKLPKLLYVASAPQGNGQTGEVLVFDFAVHPNNLNDPLERTIKIYQKFLGRQMGEYFGFALLADDFNGDGLYDLAIAAPFYASKSNYDTGKVYIFLNEGEARFAEQPALVSTYEGNGRFGTTLSRIGDINHDGFNDIAIGAPYDETGKVYIFLGSRNGISTKPSQVISAPANAMIVNSIEQSMFGHGISKGVDIDNNQFNDLAIGSPNSEKTFIYRSYPVVKIQASITPDVTEISENVTKTRIKACYYYTTSKVDLPFNFDLDLTIRLDPQLNRAKFIRGENNEFKTKVTATKQKECIESEISLVYSLADIFKPISLEIHYELAKKFQDSASFCENCVALNPAEPAMSQNKIVFSTGCKEIRCVADLKVSSRVIDTQLPYVLGSSKSLSIEYNVENGGETAYLTKITIQIPTMATFHKVPSNCKLEDYIMYCDLAHGKPLFMNEKTSFVVTIGTTRLEGTEFWIKSNVTSNSDEKFGDDNFLNYIIPLQEFSEIEILGHSTPSLVSVEEAGLIRYNILHEFELTNSGPSNIKHMNFIVSLPLVYKTDYPLHQATLIDFENMTAIGQYDGKSLEAKRSQIVNLNKPRSLQPQNLIVLNSKHDINAVTEQTSAMTTQFAESSTTHYNRYRREIITSHNETHIVGYTSQFDATFNNLPQNRLLYFNCSNIDANHHDCVHLIFEIKDFRASDKTIKIKLNFTVDLSKVDLLYTEMRDIFVMVTSTRIGKLNDNDGKSVRIINIDPYTIITKYVKIETPIWPIILSILIGILVLAIVSYVMYKMGFFKREKKEEMERLTRQSQGPTSEGEEE